MPTIIQYSSVDATAYADEYILPSTLNSGLLALYLFDRGATRSATNLAIGGLQGASFVGSPTINSDGTMTFSGGTTYLQTPIMETGDLTAMMVAYSNAPLTGESSTLFDCAAADFGRTPIVACGLHVNDFTASTAPDGKLSSNSYYGNTGANPPTAITTTTLDIPQWRTPSLLYFTTGNFSGSYRSILGSQTLGTQGLSTVQALPRFVNTTLPIRIGAGYSGSSAGQTNQGCWAYWNRTLSTAERAAFQTWISTRTLRRHGYSV